MAPVKNKIAQNGRLIRSSNTVNLAVILSIMSDRYSTAAEIQSLVDNKVSESKEIDFKRDLPGKSSGEKKEFLADVSSFANTNGGSLIYGVREEGGVAVEISGVSGYDDQVILRLEASIRDGIAPRLTIKPFVVELPGNRRVLVLSIPRSWARPHMVTFETSNKFHARGASGKFALDVSQLRAAFSEAEVAGKRIRDFRLDRLARIAGGDTPYPIIPGPKYVLHMVPLAEDPTRPRFDISGLAQQSTDINPIYGGRMSSRVNFDGLVTYGMEGTGNPAYLQLFRSGAIESVDAQMFGRGDKNLIPCVAFEEAFVDALRRYLRVQKELGAECPIVVMLSLLGVKGFMMATPQGFWSHRDYPIDRDDLIIPEFLVESWDVDAATAIKPAFDAVWQASGWEGSPFYDKKTGARKSGR